MNKAQEYLLNAGISDIVVYGGDSQDPNDWKYLSDVLGEFHLTNQSSGGDNACAHHWVDATNEVIKSGKYCTKCHGIKAE